MRKILVFLVFLAFIIPAVSWAAPSASAQYREADLGGGSWRYDYALRNTSDPGADAGCGLYDLVLHFAPAATFNVLSLPAGWSVVIAPGVARFFSTASDADITPGSSPVGLSFTVNYQAGPLMFDATLVNPADADNPILYGGSSELQVDRPKAED